jgi:hypothetical protein
MYNAIVRVILPGVIGVLIGGGGVAYLHRNDVTAAAGSLRQAQGGARAAGVADGGGARDDLSELRADVARLKTNAPSQSHTMSDVGYHWTNLWFAAEKKNWPLAQFYFDEARQHIQWTIKIRPIRKDPDGRDVDLAAIFQAVDSTTFAAVKVAIALKDSARFESAYKGALDGCYSCHKSSGKPYLRPIVPTAPAQTIIDFSPDATAPQ